MISTPARALRLQTLPLLFALVAAGAGRWAHATEPVDVTLPGVVLRPGVTADVHYAVYAEKEACLGSVVLAVHGVAHSAASWGPFAETVLREGLGGRQVCKLIAVDLPGHGASGLPVGGPKFGSLRLQDYVAVVRASLEQLPALGLQPDTLLGHSQGGLLIQLTQKTLLAGGTSLQALGIGQAILLSSVGPRQVPWEFVDSGAALPILIRFVRVSRTLGLHVSIPDAAWPSVFFLDLTGAVVGAPAPADVARYNSRESLTSSLQLIGFGFPRPSVQPGLFSPAQGTGLTVVALENDTIIRPHENTLLFEHLTGQPAGGAVIVVAGPTAVHDMHVADPGALVAAIAAATP
jgi:pimeloyl-ACP methyl ester carboxylesterase